MKIYLAGGINNLSDSDCRDWRSAVKEMLHPHNIETLDPMRRDYRGRELEFGIAEEIVRGDLEDINACDIMLANCIRPSWGTAMEIHYAAAVAKKIVIAVVPLPSAASPWLFHFSDFLAQNYQEAVEVIFAHAAKTI